MNLETLSDPTLIFREAQIGRNAAERLRKDGNRAAEVVAVEVARPLGRWHAAFYPVGAHGRQFDTKVTVTITQIPLADLIQRE